MNPNTKQTIPFGQHRIVMSWPAVGECALLGAAILIDVIRISAESTLSQVLVGPTTAVLVLLALVLWPARAAREKAELTASRHAARPANAIRPTRPVAIANRVARPEKGRSTTPRLADHKPASSVFRQPAPKIAKPTALDRLYQQRRRAA